MIDQFEHVEGGDENAQQDIQRRVDIFIVQAQRRLTNLATDNPVELKKELSRTTQNSLRDRATKKVNFDQDEAFIESLKPEISLCEEITTLLMEDKHHYAEYNIDEIFKYYIPFFRQCIKVEDCIKATISKMEDEEIKEGFSGLPRKVDEDMSIGDLTARYYGQGIAQQALNEMYQKEKDPNKKPFLHFLVTIIPDAALKLSPAIKAELRLAGDNDADLSRRISEELTRNLDPNKFNPYDKFSKMKTTKNSLSNAANNLKFFSAKFKARKTLPTGIQEIKNILDDDKNAWLDGKKQLEQLKAVVEKRPNKSLLRENMTQRLYLKIKEANNIEEVTTFIAKLNKHLVIAKELEHRYIDKMIPPKGVRLIIDHLKKHAGEPDEAVRAALEEIVKKRPDAASANKRDIKTQNLYDKILDENMSLDAAFLDAALSDYPAEVDAVHQVDRNA
jgi:hypothetical protein